MAIKAPFAIVGTLSATATRCLPVAKRKVLPIAEQLRHLQKCGYGKASIPPAVQRLPADSGSFAVGKAIALCHEPSTKLIRPLSQALSAMPKSLTDDIRQVVLEAIANGASCREAAIRFGVSVSTARRWQEFKLKEGRTVALLRGGDRRSGRIEEHAEFLLELVKQHPELRLEDIREELLGRGLSVGSGTIWRFFERHGARWSRRVPLRPQAVE